MVARAKSPVASALGIALRDFAAGSSKVLKIGFLAPLTGPLKAWSAPGLDGCRIWVDLVNAGGGIKVGTRRYLVELIPFDTMYQPERAFQGAKKLILEDGVKLLLVNGGNDLTTEVRRLISDNRMLVAGLLPSDLSPDTPTLVAPSEVHPIYNVTGVDWLKRTKPHLKTAAMCAQNDLFGLPSIATYRAAFEAAGIELIAERVFDPETSDFRADRRRADGRQPRHPVLGYRLRAVRARADGRGLQERLQGPASVLHLRQLRGADPPHEPRVHGGLRIPVPRFRRSSLERRPDELRGPERLLRGVLPALSRHLERGVLGIRVHVRALEVGRSARPLVRAPLRSRPP